MLDAGFTFLRVSKPRSFTMLTLLGMVLLVLLGPSSCDDTVVGDIGNHVMDHLSELLSPKECLSFYTNITGPEKVVLNLELFSEGKKPVRTHRWQDITSTDQCKKTLSHWLDAEGDTMYWDCLSQALQAIGCSDVSVQLGKNLNQDKSVEMKENVGEDHKKIQHLEEHKIHGQVKQHRDRETTVPKPIKWNRFELFVDMKLLSSYKRSLFSWVTLLVVLVYRIFLNSFVLGALALYSFNWILKKRCEAYLRMLFSPLPPLPPFPFPPPLHEEDSVDNMYQ